MLAVVITGADTVPDSALDGIGPVRRLGPDAIETDVAAPPDMTALRTARPGLDVNCVPLANRRKQLLIADMDSTMIPVECIDEIADAAGVRDAVVAITEPAMRGEMSFEEALEARVTLLAGFPASGLQQVFEERIALNPGARSLVCAMGASGAHTALVSGGFTFFTERVASAAGFHEHRANTLDIVDGHLTGSVVPPILGRASKREALDAMTTSRGLTPADAVAVGDGANDLDMIHAAGLGVAYRAKPVVAEAADARLDHSDLAAILYLQGWHRHEFNDF